MSEIYSVSEFNRYIKSCIDSNPVFNNVAVSGEISNYKLYPSGHHYFSLKDENCQIKCVMFKSSAISLKFRPQNGMSVIALGRVSIYERDGVYQLYCNALMEQGVGSLQLAFENLKAKLESEGLFSEAHKKPVPEYPDRIAVVTSPVGAAVEDIKRILGLRWPLSEVIVVPVRVQGIEAPEEICKAIEFVNENNLADLIITGRGGGSIEDLWAFNDEGVARAIYASDIPVISAVGHEPDVTIADFVADRRASTPSNAAEIAVPDIQEIRSLLNGYALQLSPENYINNKRQDFDRIRDKISSALGRILASKKNSFVSAASSLEALSPLKVLSRGYAIAEKEGKCVKSSTELVSGDRFTLAFSDGKKECTVN